MWGWLGPSYTCNTWFSIENLAKSRVRRKTASDARGDAAVAAVHDPVSRRPASKQRGMVRSLPDIVTQSEEPCADRWMSKREPVVTFRWR